ncbi:hypothetical protein OUZ56_007188 [Daphnia magna]|uniref:Uncharacterized protein n=1 Tax=Daphnia magna TaxID=35525 RepID=A0ABQ9YYC8_9CRUS|nr:hypothetical protein OUZ56_007188 [Daphnia magna]
MTSVNALRTISFENHLLLIRLTTLMMLMIWQRDFYFSRSHVADYVPPSLTRTKNASSTTMSRLNPRRLVSL